MKRFHKNFSAKLKIGKRKTLIAKVPIIILLIVPVDDDIYKRKSISLLSWSNVTCISDLERYLAWDLITLPNKVLVVTAHKQFGLFEANTQLVECLYSHFNQYILQFMKKCIQGIGIQSKGPVCLNKCLSHSNS